MLECFVITIANVASCKTGFFVVHPSVTYSPKWLNTSDLWFVLISLVLSRSVLVSTKQWAHNNRYFHLHYFRIIIRRVTAELIIHFGAPLLCPWDIGNVPKKAVSTRSMRGRNCQSFVTGDEKPRYSHRRCRAFFRGRGLPEKKQKLNLELGKGVYVKISTLFGSWLWLDNLRRRAGSTASISGPSTPIISWLLYCGFWWLHDCNIVNPRHWQIRPMTFSLVITFSSERRLDLVTIQNFRWTITPSISDPYILDLLETRKVAGKKRVQGAFRMWTICEWQAQSSSH